MPVILIPINPADRQLIETMTRPSAPKWMRIAACLALEGRRVVLPKEGHPVIDTCKACGVEGLFLVRAFHKNEAGGDPRCLVTCDGCGHEVENRPLITLEAREQNPLKGLRAAF